MVRVIVLSVLVCASTQVFSQESSETDSPESSPPDSPEEMILDVPDSFQEISPGEPEEDAPELFRVWTDKTGSHVQEARFVRVEDDKVILEGRDGRELSIVLSELSLKDKEYLILWNQAELLEALGDEKVQEVLSEEGIKTQDLRSLIVPEREEPLLIPRVNFKLTSLDKKEVPRAPQEEMKVVIEHLQTIPESARLSQRYLTLYSIPPSLRDRFGRVLSIDLNQLSWSKMITRPEVVPRTDGRILTFNYANYCRNQEDYDRWTSVWERLTLEDPYFLEPWVDPQEALKLREMTGSSGALLRGDWFHRVSMQDDNPATKEVEGYYREFLGLPDNEEDLLKFVKIRKQDILDLGVEEGAIIVNSGEGGAIPVAYNNRRIIRWPTLMTVSGGYFYQTEDVFNSVGAKSFMDNPLPDENVHDGSEKLGSLPNFLMYGYLSGSERDPKNKSRKAVSEVPITLARDNNFDDRVVKNFRSCFVCHTRGINYFVNSFQQLMASGKVDIHTQKPEDVIRLRELYDVDWNERVREDQIRYSNAILLASGMEPREAALAFAELWNFYDVSVAATQAAREFGVAPEGLEGFLTEKGVQSSQGSLLSLLEGLSMKRDTFESRYADAMLLPELRKNLAKGGKPVSELLEAPKVGTVDTFDSAGGDSSPFVGTYVSPTVIAEAPTGTTWSIFRDKNSDGVPDIDRDRRYSSDEMDQMLKDRFVESSDLVWRSDWSEWKPVSEAFPEIFSDE